MSDLQRVLAALDMHVRDFRAGSARPAMADAARVIRELAADFDRFGTHWPDCMARFRWEQLTACTCGLDAARAKWRLTEEPKSGGSCG